MTDNESKASTSKASLSSQSRYSFLVFVQNELLEAIQKTLFKVKTNVDDEHTSTWLQSRKSMFKVEMELSTENNSKILSEVSLKDVTIDSYIKNKTYTTIRESYCDLIAIIDELLEKLHPKPDQPVHEKSRSHSELTLPKLDLPKFSGKYEEWLPFNNLFTARVHNKKNLEPVEKLHYLMDVVTGDAYEEIKNLSLTDENYQMARDILDKQFNHKRKVAHTYMQKLLDTKQISNENAKELRMFISNVNDCSISLTQLGLPVDQWSYILLYVLQTKIPQATYIKWEEELGASRDIPKIEKFMEFLENRYRTLEMVQIPEKEVKKSSKVLITKNVDTSNPPKTSAKISKWNKKEKKINRKTVNTPCSLCSSSEHYISRCKSFLNNTPLQRKQLAIQNNLCLNCLGASHTVDVCYSLRTCVYCRQKHHSLLHIHEPNNQTIHTSNAYLSTQSSSQNLNHLITEAQQNLLPVSNLPSTSTNAFHATTNNPTVTILGTALVQLISPSGFTTTVRILLDSGAEENYITSSTVQSIGLPKYAAPSSITGLNGITVGSVEYKVNFTLRSLDGKFEYPTCASIVDNITSKMPSRYIEAEMCGFLNNLCLADPNFNHPGKIQLLVGVGFVARIRQSGIKRYQDLLAEQTLLGWVIMGQTKADDTNKTQQNSRVFLTKRITNEDLSRDLQKFFEVEECIETIPPKPEDEKCEKLFVDSITRCSDGKLMVELPFKEEQPTIGSSRHIALHRFLNLEKKLEKHQTLKEEYHNTFKDYIQSGHLVPIPACAEEGKEFYLPHHAVIKEDSTTTKVRVVFDGSCKSADGSSLNDHLHTGPKLQRDIKDIFFKWRLYKIALTADIAKMYRMFWVAEKHRSYQRILWRFSQNEPIAEYALATVTFGTSSAPYQAMRALNYIAETEQANFPSAASSLLTEFYVDDLISGSHCISTAVEKQNQLRELLSSYGLKIRKWGSNCEEALEGIQLEDRETLQELQFEEQGFRKTLGVYWAPKGDFFSFSTNKFLNTEHQLTKRNVLSVIARLYDPIGWVSPCTLHAKLIMQRIWEQKIDWDQEVCGAILKDFRTFLSDLPKLSEIKIDRWINIIDDTSSVTLYGFADASSRAYGAVIYLQDPENPNRLILLSSKTRLKPLKHISLARLELCAAVMLSELMVWAETLLKPRKVRILAFSDSKIVLSWLAAHPSRWKTYVAGRTHKILKNIPSEHWFYINTKHNPADLASRGALPSDLINNSLWWDGPSLQDISQDNNLDINMLTEQEQTDILTEEKCNKNVFHSVVAEGDDNLAKLMTKFSSHGKLCRIVDYIRTFLLTILKKLAEHFSQYMQTYLKLKQRFRNAERIIFWIVQRQHYLPEIVALSNNEALPKKSSLASLFPFLDGFGILRVGGRIQEALIPYSQKHPIILPARHQVTTNLVYTAHHITLHGPNSLATAYLRQKFHIIRLSDRIKFVSRRCPKCIRFARRMHEQLMGSLPGDRVNPHRAFLNSGVDYAGPYTLKAYKGRCKIMHKYYVALFVCFTTKALHLEIVSELTANAFLAAFRRFVSRRGQCQTLYSDQGTNFVKGDKMLLDEIHRAQIQWKTDLEIDFHAMGTKWKFNPPGAPHFGGLWEAGVKSFKAHLNKTISNTLLTPEEFNTILIQIEGILNSRPLCRMGTDPREFMFLTPAHFLVGESIISPPERLYDCTEKGSKVTLDRWQYIQRLRQMFWRSWKKDYLHQLNTRSKWKSKGIEFKENSLVILTDENHPPNYWPMAIITDIHPGKDGQVRVVTLRTQKGQIFKRPISKLRLLPFDGESTQREDSSSL